MTNYSETSAIPQNPQLAEGKTSTQESLEQDPAETSQPVTDGPHLQILPSAASITVGKEISITLQGENFASTGNSSLTLSYDPAVLTFKNAVEGPFWANQLVPSSLTVSVVPNLGKIMLQMGQQGKSVQGSGSLATVVFEAAGPGNSTIDIQQSTVLGANGQPIPVMVQHGRILVE
ncbi:MAG: cohesin domain-containing protein [Nitrospirales bacterium]|nr:cohesin domain-containing protein [Nitrospirales bacterium]